MSDAQIPVGTRTAKRKSSAEQPLATKKRPQAGVANDLCSDCSRLDLTWAQQMARKEDWHDGFLAAHVGKKYRQPFETNCTLCRILLASRQASIAKSPLDDKDLDSADELRACVFWRYYPLFDAFNNVMKRVSKGNEAICLKVVSSRLHARRSNLGLEEGCPVIETDGPQHTGPTIGRVPRNFDAAVALNWIRYCGRHHKTICSHPNISSVRDLNLIDCQTRSVGPIQDNPPYVALSYVWGTPTASDESNPDTVPRGSCSLPSILPRVILDAIAVTKALNLRYLWVDKFCIDQNNPQQKHEQIRSMSK